MTARVGTPFRIPELGPSLGRLLLPSGAPVAAPPAPLPHFAAIRLDLVTALLELAGAARAELEGGDAGASVRRLAPERWRALWESAATAAAAVVRARIDEEMVRAAGRSGFPLRRLLRLAVSDDEARSIQLRLSACAAPLAVALDDVARTSAEAAWPDAVVRAAQALEVSWLELESVAVAEEDAWRPEVERIAHWAPARWPRWVAAAAVLVVTGYAGLVLGGYLPVPAPLRPAARYWWDKVEP